MTYAAFARLCRFYTQTSPASFSDDELVLLANAARDEITSTIANRQGTGDVFLVPASTDLVEDRREYAFPPDKLNAIKYVEAKLDGTNFIILKELDLVQYDRPTDETTIISRFNNSEGGAAFDIHRDSLWVYSGSIVAVEDGLKLWYQAFLKELNTAKLASTDDMSTDVSSTEHGFPRLFHELLARLVSIMWKGARDKPVPLSPRESSYMVDLEMRIQEFSGYNVGTSFKASVPVVSGWNM